MRVFRDTVILRIGPSSLRRKAAQSLGDMDDPKAITPLIAALRQDRSESVRAEAAKALGGFFDAKAREAPVAAWEDGSQPVREAIPEAIVQSRDSAIDALIRALQDESIQDEVKQSLGRIGLPAIRPLMAKFLDDDESTRFNAAEALARVGSTAIEPLVEAMHDPNWQVRQASVIAFGFFRLGFRFESMGVLGTFRYPTLHHGGYPDYSGVAVESEDYSRAYKALVGVVSDPSPRVQQAVASSLGNMGDGVQVLKEMLETAHEPVRQAAANALMRIDRQFPLNTIVDGLRHRDAQVRLALLRAIQGELCRLNELSSARELPFELKGWFVYERSSRRFKVGESTTTIMAALIELSHDADGHAREAVLVALESLRATLERLRLKGPNNVWGVEGAGAAPIVLWLLEPVIRRLFKPPPSVAFEETEAEKAAVDVAREAAGVTASGSRYADFAFYEGGNERGARVPGGHCLCAQKQYQLEVAVRAKPTGIPSEGPKRSPVLEPQQQQDATIMVTAERVGDGFEIDEPVQTLTLPPVGDSSTNAVFHVRPLHESKQSDDLAKIRVRLYYGFNLLEVSLIRAEVVGDSPSHSRWGLKKPISFRQERLPCDYLDLHNILTRAMHVDITRQGEHYLFNFAFKNDAKQELVFTAPARLQSTELESELISIRKIWYDIAMSKTFSEQIEGDSDEFLANVRRLAKAGRRLWVALFRQDRHSALYRIGQWLEDHPLQQDGIVQISVDEDAASFVFPWALIYDREVPEKDCELPAPEGFWGMRYCIEQQLLTGSRGTDKPIHVEELKLAFMLWEEFRNAKEERQLMQRLVQQSAGKLEVSTPPIIDNKTCRNLLLNCDAQILYFYTHGYTRHREADIGAGPNLELFIQRYERLNQDDPRRATNRLLYESIKQEGYEPDRSWIELTRGKLYLDELYEKVDNLQSNPLVILNMCESAQITPSLLDSFFHFFLNRGARGVIGTECPMTLEFAHPFAALFLEDILAGEQVGIALLKARRHFMKLRNPLGLAYTLFGLATISFEPPRFHLMARETGEGREEVIVQ